jgi:sensor histidine kinase YesM
MPKGAEGLAKAFLVSFIAYFPVLLAVVAVDNRSPADEKSQAIRLCIAVVLAQAMGTFLTYLALPHLYPDGYLRTRSWSTVNYSDRWLRAFPARVLAYLAYSGTAVAVYFYLRRESRMAARLHAEEVQRQKGELESAEARLQVMQAQIEPHFLFNTLASVRRLYRTDLAAGRGMMRHLTSYLAASLPGMRESRSTLGRELALTTAYLNVQKMRMETRLDFGIDVPERLLGIVVPPMMLATLVENAVIHGLSPLPAGGRIEISAEEHAGKLLVRVTDNGRGLKDTWGAGVGLSNIRARLQSAFGNTACLRLAAGDERGVVATLEIPMTAEAATA